MRVGRGFSILALFTVLSSSVTAQESSLLDFVRSRGARLEWQPVLEAGRLVAEHGEVRLKVGVPFAVVDGHRKVTMEPPFRSGGAVLLTSEAVTRLDGILEQLAAAEEAGPRIAFVLIDPGHGGKDPGAIGRYEGGDGPVTVEEKAVALAVARNLKDALGKRYPDKRIELTRDGDRYVSLEERTRLANEIPVSAGEAIIFISVHVNAAFNRRASGFEVWYLPPEYRRDLSDRTRAEGVSEEIVPILSSMLEAEYATESAMLRPWRAQWNAITSAEPIALAALNVTSSLSPGPRPTAHSFPAVSGWEST